MIRDNKTIYFQPVRVQGAKQPVSIPIEGGEDNVAHWANLLDNHRSGTQDTWSPIDLAYRTQTVMIMAMLSCRQRRVAGFDTAAQKITFGG